VEDFPTDLSAFEAGFSTEEAWREYLIRLRWPDGFHCRRCGSNRYWRVREVLLQGVQCGHQASARGGTIFQDTRSPLRLWFRWVAAQKNGASALGLQRILGLKNDRTAWTGLHKLRRARVRPGRDRLAGAVEVDQAYRGGLEEGLRGRQVEAKALMVVAAQEDGQGMGRIRLRQIADASAARLIRFIEDAVEPGSVVHTDGGLGYEPWEKKGYRHTVTVLRGQEKSPSELMPRVHRVVSLFKRWRIGTHQGAVSRKPLDYSLDEFTFRFNRRRSQS
jgi:transposase-like protein